MAAVAPSAATETSTDPAPGASPSVVLPPELVAHIRRIEIRARRLASTLLAGDYRSVFRGSGIEFAEAREYVPGDDVRMIDWNVTARMGTPWVKQYVEERELNVVCAVDLSASQLVARPGSGRLGAAAEICALLSFAAAYNHDLTGLLTFSDRVERFVPPARGARHVLRLVREVLFHAPPQPGTDVAAASDYLSQVLRRRSIVFLISDLFDGGYERSLLTLARRHEGDRGNARRPAGPRAAGRRAGGAGGCRTRRTPAAGQLGPERSQAVRAGGAGTGGCPPSGAHLGRRR